MIEEKNDLMKNIAGNDNNKMRKYLILGGGVFVLFVIGIVVSKFMFSSPKKSDTAVILPPDIQQNQKAQKNDTALFNDIPVENEENNGFKKPTNTAQQPAQPAQQTNQQQPQKLQQKQPQQTTSTQPVEKTTNQPKTVEVKDVTKPKATEQKVVQQTKTTQKTNTNTNNVKKGYYLQVAAVTRGNPSKKFLELIKKNGFDYKIVEVNIKGLKVRRVLVGPFTYKELKKALPKVKQKISSSAFVKRIK